MVFSSLILLFFFLPVTVVLYVLINKVSKRSSLVLNLYLCVASLIFYYWGAGKSGVGVLLLLIGANYVFSYIIRVKRSKLSFVLGIVFNCAVIIKYKYPLLMLQALNAYLTEDAELIMVAFPLGLSFIIFHCISYLADVYRENFESAGSEGKEFVGMCLYVLFFPKLIQGPIVKYKDMRSSLYERTFTFDRLCEGTERFLIGLGKKVLLAKAFGISLKQISRASAMDVPTAWLSILLYGLQLYLDFSGYSDMAIGAAKIFGFDFKENFNFPYISTSISEFWRRWHISLGSWFREYIYIPLGGNRTGSVYINLFVVFVLTGMWHGNTVIYICWGIAHGLVVLFERTKLYQKLKARIPGFSVIGWIYTTLVVGVGWLCFRLDGVGEFIAYLKNLVGIGIGELSFTWQYYLTPKLIFMLLISCAGIFVFSRESVRAAIKRYNKSSKCFCILKYLCLLVLFGLSVMTIVSNGYTPFLYFAY